MPEERIREIGLDPGDRRLALTMSLVEEIIGFPRHLSQHVGGFVITEGRLDELVPVENAAMEDRTVICWDKDDIDALGILKVDVLALGMLTCIRKGFDLIAEHHGTRYTLATLPAEDPAVYDMLCRADSLGVFQVESRAQMSFLPRLRPRCFYDLVIEVAIVRPGPIQGDMVHPFLRRRRGEEKVEFPSDALGRGAGQDAGGAALPGAGDADRHHRRGLLARGGGPAAPGAGDVQEDRHHPHLPRAVPRRAWRGTAIRPSSPSAASARSRGSASTAFPRAMRRASRFLVYASAWLKRHHPAVFACALLNAQPMGFYAPAQIVRDARAHGVEVRPVCINASAWDNGLEPDGRGGLALRLGFRQIKGMREEDADWIVAARGNGYRDVGAVWRRAGVAAADAGAPRRRGRLREPGADAAGGALAGAGDRRRGAAAALRRDRGGGGGRAGDAAADDPGRGGRRRLCGAAADAPGASHGADPAAAGGAGG